MDKQLVGTILVGMESEDCTREGYLNEKESMMIMEKDWQICRRKRTEPGFATLMNTRYGKKEEV